MKEPKPRCPSGVLVVDKPKGPTSHDVVARLRKILKTSRIGHAGTLDPMATGVLVIAVEEATKLVPYLTASDKAYDAELALGVETDTLDAEGQVTRSEPIRADLAQALDDVGPLLHEAAAREAARTEQVPPIYSAIRIDGERAHEMARRGEDVSLAPRPIAIRHLAVVGASREPPRLALQVRAMKGFFVRSLARDLARTLGTLGHLTALRRTQSGRFSLAEALPLEPPPTREAVLAALLPLDVAAARALPSATLGEEGLFAAARGQRLAPEWITDGEPPSAPSEPTAWFDAGGRLVAIGERGEDGSGRVVRGFVDAGRV